MRWINVHQETYISQLEPDSYSNIAGSAKPLPHEFPIIISKQCLLDQISNPLSRVCIQIN